LGELEGAEAAKVAETVRLDPTLQAVVAEVQALSETMESVLGAEPLPTVEEFELKLEPSYSMPCGKVVKFPYYWVSGAVAAAFAVMVLIQEKDFPQTVPQETMMFEMDLQAEPAVPMSLPVDSAPKAAAETAGGGEHGGTGGASTPATEEYSICGCSPDDHGNAAGGRASDGRLGPVG